MLTEQGVVNGLSGTDSITNHSGSEQVRFQKASLEIPRRSKSIQTQLLRPIGGHGLYAAENKQDLAGYRHRVSSRAAKFLSFGSEGDETIDHIGRLAQPTGANLQGFLL